METHRIRIHYVNYPVLPGAPVIAGLIGSTWKQRKVDIRTLDCIALEEMRCSVRILHLETLSAASLDCRGCNVKAYTTHVQSSC